MATLALTITEVTTADYDGVNETVKRVTCELDGARLPQIFSYPTTTTDAEITTAVRTNLAAKGYVFD